MLSSLAIGSVRAKASRGGKKPEVAPEVGPTGGDVCAPFVGEVEDSHKKRPGAEVARPAVLFCLNRRNESLGSSRRTHR